jgi:2'-5' RNA ligase
MPARGTHVAVVCAAFDIATDLEIFRVRDVVRSAGIAMPERPPHRPHLSLSAARVESDRDLSRLLDVARAVAAGHAPVPIALSEVGRFGRAGVVWLGPAPEQRLADLQHAVYRALADEGWPPAFGERSAPQHWIAHCTLATRIPKPQLRTVEAAVRESYRPIHGAVDALATILVGGRGDVDRVGLG